MKILISGSSGLVGTPLVRRLRELGHSVLRLIRNRDERGADCAFWDPRAGTIEAEKLEGMDAVIHLAGESVSSHRWTAAEKTRILESRTKGTALLGRTVSSLNTPPKVFLSASAIGYYGDHGATELTEQDGPGNDFLARVCIEWEQAAKETVSPSIRLVLLRVGVVLGKEGGALKKLLLPFRLGLGGPIGDGSTYMSWIALPDIVEAIIYCLEHENIAGPINLSAPNPVPNRTFAKALGSAVHRPAIIPLPPAVLKIVFGEMAEQTILSSMRVLPQRLLKEGYRFRYPELNEALRAVI